MHKIQLALRSKSRPGKISIYKNFFKTGKGEYGEGDVFIGVTMPDNRNIAKKFIDINLEELIPILNSETHEDRMCALLILTYKYSKTKLDSEHKKLVDFYLEHRYASNNWDLIDCIVDRILGPWFIDKDKTKLYDFAKSNNLWERRTAIITTFYFIKNNKFEETIKIVKILINDKQDLIHKACGWMLREIGKRDKKTLDKFLIENYKNMPRTMLRYSIEKHSEGERKKYLLGNI